MERATATACANIALVKYWGKSEGGGNLPARGSLSLTLDALSTTTTVDLIDDPADELVLDGVSKKGHALERVTRHLDRVRALTPGGITGSKRARVVSQNLFPTGAGLASSASGFAALSAAAVRAYGVAIDPRGLSVLARQGSGSAARSIFGGFVRMYAGPDAHAAPVAGAKISLDAAIAVARAGEKEIGSTEGMEHTRATSPYHAAWLEAVDRDLAAAEAALRGGDFEALAAVTEASCLAMHADAIAARPGIIYFQPVTLWAIDRVRAMRRAGTPVFFTVDAGPHVVAFCEPGALVTVREALSAHPEVSTVITAHPGPGVEVV